MEIGRLTSMQGKTWNIVYNKYVSKKYGEKQFDHLESYITNTVLIKIIFMVYKT